MLIRDARKEELEERKRAHDIWLQKMGINPKTPAKLKKGSGGSCALPNLKVSIGRNPILPALSNAVPGAGTKKVK